MTYVTKQSCDGCGYRARAGGTLFCDKCMAEWCTFGNASTLQGFIRMCEIRRSRQIEILLHRIAALHPELSQGIY